MRLATRDVTWDLIGPPTCEIVTPQKRDAILARLGPDPLSSRPDAERVFARLRRSGVPIAHALLNQMVLAGVGNIFRAEALFVDGIHPLRPASSLAPEELARLWATVRRMMRRAVRRDRIFTLEPADTPAGRRRTGARSLYVYQEDVCLRCGSRIRSFPLSGRTMYACETCQPPPARRPAAKRSAGRR